MIIIDEDKALVTIEKEGQQKTFGFDTPEAFNAISDVWLRVGWDCKHVYSFTWMGRPVIQLPEDMIRIQEVIYQIKPDVIIETGVAHGGSLIYYASLCKAMDKGRVIGVDIEIRPHNRAAIEAHPLFSYISLVEGSSVDETIVQSVKDQIKPGETVLVILDSCHTKAHVAAELEAYAPMVSSGSYIVATDGIMGTLAANAPRTQPDWSWNNPTEAAREFAEKHPEFVIEEPPFEFNEGVVNRQVTYWPGAYVKKIG